MNMQKHHILVVPNEDGMGPSALVSYVAKELLLRDPQIQITVWNKSRFDFNCGLYDEYISSGRVKVLAIWNIIQLDKPFGEVSIPGTLKRIGDYRNLSNQYPSAYQTLHFDLVLDFGVPAAARWAAENGIKSVTVFDHSWSKTLRLILEDMDKLHPEVLKSSDEYRKDWHKLIHDIQLDETFTRHLFIFPPFITPDIFRQHWEQTTGNNGIQQFEAVLGGHSSLTEDKVLEQLRLPELGDTILVLGGDTPVWDTVLEKVILDFVTADMKGELADRNVNIVINVPKRLIDMPKIKEALSQRNVRRVRQLSLVRGGTIQELLPAIKFLFTRAGGGSVNDAVACRVPFVCVREPAQSQVEEILKTCQQRGLTRAIEAEAFQQQPKDIILREFEKRKENEGIIRRMKDIANQGEQVIAKSILELLRKE